jgi:peptide/nickel transport system substrate-binding protein
VAEEAGMLMSVRYAAGAAAIIVALPLLGLATPAGQDAARPRYGGTLRLVAAAGPDHLDPVPAYYTADYILERAYARQLVSYPAVVDRAAYSRGWHADITPVADAATAVPTVANGGITNAGTTYTFHIRPGVNWNTRPVRPVVAQDFLREFKAFCNPVSPVGYLPYFTVTIKGMKAYCAAEARHFARIGSPAARQIAAFQNSHSISGITTPDSSTIRFHLTGPAPDFIDILALPFASARPVEYDKFLPDSFALDRHTISDGPYQITSYRPGLSIVLRRNPAWRQSSDPLRHQYVRAITMTIGITSSVTQIADLKANVYDLMDDTQVEPSDIPGLSSDRDFHIWPGGYLLPYVVFNLRSPNSRHATGKLDVRRAIEYGIDKAAIERLLGGETAAPILDSVIPAGNAGHLSANPYPSRGGRGNSAKCRAELAKAGFRHRLKLRYLYSNDSINTEVFAEIQASLSRCGIRLIGVPGPGSSFFADLGNAPVNNLPGTWDLGQPGWIPDWYGNNGRSIIDPLFRTHCVVNTYNYGCYNSRAVDRLIAAAESARSARAAGVFWLRAGEQIMKDAAIVPLVAEQSPIYASPEVHEAGVAHGVMFLPNIGGPDITNVWIKR